MPVTYSAVDVDTDADAFSQPFIPRQTSYRVARHVADPLSAVAVSSCAGDIRRTSVWFLGDDENDAKSDSRRRLPRTCSIRL